MRVRAPESPSFDSETSALEKLVTHLGCPPSADLDEESEQLASSLVQQVAVFARRGWTCMFDAESDYSDEVYPSLIGDIVSRSGLSAASVEVDDSNLIIKIGESVYSRAFEHIQQTDDWLDNQFIAEFCATALAPHGITVVATMDEQCFVIAAVPTHVWSAVLEAGLAGGFSEVMAGPTSGCRS